MVGSEAFVKKLRPQLWEKEKTIPNGERLAARPTLASLLGDTEGDKARRDTKIHEAVRRHGYALGEVGKVIGLHDSTISRIVKRVGRTHQTSGDKL